MVSNGGMWIFLRREIEKILWADEGWVGMGVGGTCGEWKERVQGQTTGTRGHLRADVRNLVQWKPSGICKGDPC